MPKMHGPAFDESGKIVEREVPAADVVAFQNAGYVLGGKPVEDDAVTSPEVAAKASRILTDPKSSSEVKSVAASALKQTRKK